ncbi:hypothetical protein EZI54_20865 [Marinobacter halodurans]|uniref:Uncharacterized protein n=1 Tax=Marinobacter halodurans TaxID=2528979 RepID=A0ABY1ZES5_9GAMM|nr:hypothetical protein [Marinobacter halodurans]TBW48742.1 hypothetical protein EZI54_20865 [Marinobacter halodurans]
MTSENTIPARIRWRHLMLAALLGVVPVMAQADEPQQPPTMEALKHDTENLIDKLGNYSAEQRDEAAASIKESLDELDQRIDVLEKRLDENWDDMSEASREKTQQSLDALRAQREKVGDWYERLKGSSANAWEDVKDGFTRAYDNLSDAWKDTEESMSSGN